MKALILFYSMYGHNFTLAQAAAEGVESEAGCQAVIKRVPETLPEDVLQKMGALETQKQWAHIPEATRQDPGEFDALMISTPTRFGNMCGQMRQYMDGLGQLWASHALVGKPGAVMTSSNTRHGGQESTILTAHVTLLHLGMVIVGLPYSFAGLSTDRSIDGGTPYGASVIAGSDGQRQPSDNEKDGARFHGAYLAQIAKKLSA